LLASYTYGSDLLSQTRCSENHYFHYDRLGSTKGLTDDNQTVTDVYNSDAFGNPLQNTGTTPNHYRFTGEQHDPQTGLIYLRARYYNPATGRFLTQDTWQGQRGKPITLHRYLYANANPVVFVDPTGHMSLGNLSATLRVHGNMMRMVKNYRLPRKGKRKKKGTFRFQVFGGQGPIPEISTKPDAHKFVYVERKNLSSGWRYDVIVTAETPGEEWRFEDDLEAFVNEGKTCNNHYDGHVVKSKTTRAEIKIGKWNTPGGQILDDVFGPSTLGKEKARFSRNQYNVWQALVIFPNFQYTLNGIDGWDCYRWTDYALQMAKMIEKLPF
jgi:RHS repeat-associated protein